MCWTKSTFRVGASTPQDWQIIATSPPRAGAILYLRATEINASQRDKLSALAVQHLQHAVRDVEIRAVQRETAASFQDLDARERAQVRERGLDPFALERGAQLGDVLAGVRRHHGVACL